MNEKMDAISEGIFRGFGRGRRSRGPPGTDGTRQACVRKVWKMEVGKGVGNPKENGGRRQWVGSLKRFIQKGFRARRAPFLGEEGGGGS